MYTTVEDFQTSIDINIYEGERSHVEGNTAFPESSDIMFSETQPLTRCCPLQVLLLVGALSEF